MGLGAALAATGIALGYVMWNVDGTRWSPTGVAFGIGFFAWGATIAAAGLWMVIAPSQPTHRLVRGDRDALRREVAARGLPFWVCTDCNLLHAPSDCFGFCPSCLEEGQCLSVRDEEDRGLMIAALS